MTCLDTKVLDRVPPGQRARCVFPDPVVRTTMKRRKLIPDLNIISRRVRVKQYRVQSELGIFFINGASFTGSTVTVTVPVSVLPFPSVSVSDRLGTIEVRGRPVVNLVI